MKKVVQSLPLIPFVEEFITKSRTGKRLQNNGRKISPGTVLNYHYLLKHLHGYESSLSEPIRIRPLNKLSGQQLIVERNYWKRFYNGFLTYIYQCGIFDNYAGKLIKILRSVFKYIEQEKMISVGNYYKSFHAPKEDVEIITLSKERLQFLILDKTFEENLPETLRLAKDIFVVGCTVALRFSDLIAIRYLDTSEMNGKTYLSVKAQKTGIPMKVQLPHYALDIINQYQKDGSSKIFPQVGLTWFNASLRRLCRLAGWNELLEKTRSQRGITKIIQNCHTNQTHRFSDRVSSHVMRRTAITTMLMSGVPEMVVKKISGHCGDSKSFYRYVNFVQSFMDSEVENHFQKMVSL